MKLFIKPGSVEYVGVGFSCIRGGGKDENYCLLLIRVPTIGANYWLSFQRRIIRLEGAVRTTQTTDGLRGSRQIKISWYFKTVIVRAECFGEDARTRGSHLWQTPRYISSWKYIACSFSLSEPKHVISARQISIDHRCAGNKSHSPTHPYPYTPHPLQCSQSVTRPQDWSTDATFYIWKAIWLFLRTSCKFVWQPYLRRLTAWHDCKIFWSASWGIFYIVALQGEFVSSGAAHGDWWREQQWYDVQRFVM